MEEPHDGQCRVVYYCPDLDLALSELYKATAPPIAPSGGEDPREPLEHVYSNVRRLLDQDQGNFAQGERGRRFESRAVLAANLYSLRQFRPAAMSANIGRI